jgi:hypothetical protein
MEVANYSLLFTIVHLINAASEVEGFSCNRFTSETSRASGYCNAIWEAYTLEMGYADSLCL